MLIDGEFAEPIDHIGDFVALVAEDLGGGGASARILRRENAIEEFHVKPVVTDLKPEGFQLMSFDRGDDLSSEASQRLLAAMTSSVGRAESSMRAR